MTKIVRQFIMFNDQAVSCFRKEFFDNGAHLYVMRTDWRFRRNWEGLLEMRMLDLPDLGDRRSLFQFADGGAQQPRDREAERVGQQQQREAEQVEIAVGARVAPDAA